MSRIETCIETCSASVRAPRAQLEASAELAAAPAEEDDSDESAGSIDDVEDDENVRAPFPCSRAHPAPSPQASDGAPHGRQYPLMGGSTSSWEA